MSNSASFFLLYPRTRQRIAEFGTTVEKLHLLKPLPYIEFLALQHRAAVVITDSGGIQEETTYLGVPCLTMRDNTERPVTVTSGTNVLVGQDRKKLLSELTRILEGNAKTGTIHCYGMDARGIESQTSCVSIDHAKVENLLSSRGISLDSVDGTSWM
jgi:UDP-N-acetylglucosamine 2-epimerase